MGRGGRLVSVKQHREWNMKESEQSQNNTTARYKDSVLENLNRDGGIRK